ncbi:hypothetical protein [Gilliamella sp. M0364]|nr:hypothetical protein [Gilliamella sp. M0364]MBI0156035.1 hypothetical protein [Gilliamella sp. M0364]
MVLIGHRASGIGHRASGIGHRAYKHLSIKNFSQLRIKIRYSYKSSNLIYSLYLFSLLLSFNINALTVQTVNVIHGNNPEVINTQIAADKHGFMVNGVFYSEFSGNIKENEIKEFDANLTFNQFAIQRFNYQSLDNRMNYQDLDGDDIDPIQPFLTTETTWQWFDANGNKISTSDKNKIIGCGSGYPMPLMLEITNQVQTFSQYGQPRKSDFVTIKKVYKIAVKSELCYAKPYATELVPEYQWDGINPDDSYSWNDPNFTQRDPKNGGGYSSDYIPNMGYKVNPTESSGRKFPTTGFSGAKFQLVMTGSQTDYQFSIPVNPDNKVSIDSRGYITLNDKPTGPVTVRATLIRNNNVIHEYTFNPTDIWVIPHIGQITIEQAVQICGGRNNMLSITELSDSPRAYDFYNLTSLDHLSNSATRQIGKSVFGEWGWVTKDGYPDSNWQKMSRDISSFVGNYWAKEINKDNPRLGFVVHSHDGFVGQQPYDFFVGPTYRTHYANALCRK